MTLLIASLILSQARAVDLSGGYSLDRKSITIECSAARATILVFLSPSCPIGNRYAPEIGRIYADYKNQNVTMYRVYPESLDSAADCRKHGQSFKLEMPAILDPKHKLVSATGVKVTPEVAVIGATGNLVYRGRIDDSNVEHGKIREDYRRDLRIALDEYLAGKKVSVPETAAIGCYIPDSD